MAFWKGKDVVSVSLSTIPFFTEDTNLLKKAIVNGILSGANIADSIVSYLKNSFKIRLNKYYKKVPELLVDGYPTAHIEFNFDLRPYYASIRSILLNEFGPVTITNAFISKLDPDFYLTYRMEKLYSVYIENDLDSRTEYLIKNTKKDKYDRDYIVIEYAAMSFLRNTETNIWIRTTQYSVGHDDNTNHYTDTGVKGEIIPYLNFFYHITFKTSDDKTHRWLYDPTTQLYPQLPLYEQLSNVPKFFPLLRIKKDWVYPEVTNPDYIKSVKLGKILGIDLNLIKNKLKENGEDNKIYNAFITNTVDLRSTNTAAIKYLYLFFNKYYTSPYNSGSRFDSNGTVTNLNFYTWSKIRQGIQLTEGTSNFYFFYSHATKHTYTGSIGKVGTYRSRITILPYLEVLNPIATAIERDKNKNNDGQTFNNVYAAIERSYISLEYQVTVDKYTVVRVHGPRFNSEIGGHESKTVRLDSDSTLPMLVPLDYNIWSILKTTEKNSIGIASVYLVLQLYQVTHLKWYETSFFGNFLNFLGAFVTLVSLGSGSGISASLEAIANGAIVEGAVAIGETILTGVILTTAAQELVKLLGPEFAFALAILAFTYSQYSNQHAFITLPGADLALAAVPAVQTGIQLEMQAALEELQGEMEVFLMNAKEKMEELDKARSLLTKDGILHPLALINSKGIINTGESVTEFMTRTIHNTNPGADTLQAITRYCSNQLRLVRTGLPV